MNLFSSVKMLVDAAGDAASGGANMYSAASTMYIAIAIIMIGMAVSSVMEGIVVATTIKGMSRNPEASSGLRTSMILGCALCETVAIYGLVLAILLLFVGNPIK